jgi:hypothetical protein
MGCCDCDSPSKKVATSSSTTEAGIAASEVLAADVNQPPGDWLKTSLAKFLREKQEQLQRDWKIFPVRNLLFLDLWPDETLKGVYYFDMSFMVDFAAKTAGRSKIFTGHYKYVKKGSRWDGPIFITSESHYQ